MDWPGTGLESTQRVVFPVIAQATLPVPDGSHYRDTLLQRLDRLAGCAPLPPIAAFEDAKFEQVHIEGRIAELEQLLATTTVVDISKAPKDIVSLGSIVHLAMSDDRTYCYTIVGSYEANPGAGRISHESPVGKALLGHTVGDQITVATPGGVKEYTILGIA
jgi:transcription elongation GreA/GreB family factor